MTDLAVAMGGVRAGASVGFLSHWVVYSGWPEEEFQQAVASWSPGQVPVV